LDNEASTTLKEYNKSEQVDYQLAPPQVHRRNAAERAIRTWKNHLTPGLCSTDTNFPLHLWDLLLEQATITLNLLRPARSNPTMSAHQMLNGTFDYNRTPLAPPGTKILIHEKPNQRRSWDPHGVEGWYLGPATYHYRCYRVYVNQTRAERITDTVEFVPQAIEMPFPTPTEIAIEATKALIHTLKDPIPYMPFAHHQYDRNHAIRTIADIFKPFGSPELQTHVIEPDVAGPTKLIPRINRDLPHTSPRVATPEPRRQSPRVAPTLIEEEPRYPRRHHIIREHSANLITTMLGNNHDENVDQAFQPKVTTDTEHWACSIIDPDTEPRWSIRTLSRARNTRTIGPIPSPTK
jgi:hypothetical protein